MYEIKLPASTQKALAESEFSRLVGDEDLNIEGLISAVEVMIVHLKDMKKIANEKYKLGSDQANAALVNLPFNGVAESNQFSLLKQRWGMGVELPPKESEYDDVSTEEPAEPTIWEKRVTTAGREIDAMIQEEDEDPTYIQRQEREHIDIPEGIHKIISEPVTTFDDEVALEDLQAMAKKWHNSTEAITEEAYERAEVMCRETTEEWEKEGEPDNPLPSAKPFYIEDSFAGIVKVENGTGTLVPLKKRVISFDDEDDLETISEPKPPKNPVLEEECIKPKKKVKLERLSKIN